MSGWMLAALRHPWLTVGGVAALAAVGGFLVAASGVIPITASSGHWAITEWFLHFSMKRSVATHSRLVAAPPPDLDSAARVMRGAGHFETGCRPCHGAPGDALPPIPQAMTPAPPALSGRVPDYNPRELFYIVKHGVKFTGMPAWPALSRDDEVWAMVAFLRRLPALDGDSYEQIVRGEETTLGEMFAGTTPMAAPPDVIAEVCARCHGADGSGRGVEAFPKIGGQRLEYLRRAMDAYADGRRHSGIMEPIASGLTADAREAALAYYAAQSGLPSALTPAGDAALRGAEIAARGVPAEDIPACASCHGPGAAPVDDAYPRLAGQYREYIADQLKLLKERRRGGSEYVQIMHTFVDRLSPDHIRDLAAYYSSDAGSGR